MAQPTEEEPSCRFTPEEQELMAALREKYAASGGAGAGAAAPVSAQPQHQPQQQQPQPAGAAPRPSACRECAGIGTLSEAYAGRMLQRCCPACGGDGVAGSAGAAKPAAPTSTAGGSRLAAYERELAAVRQGLAACTHLEEAQLRRELALQLEKEVARLRAAAHQLAA